VKEFVKFVIGGENIVMAFPLMIPHFQHKKCQLLPQNRIANKSHDSLLFMSLNFQNLKSLNFFSFKLSVIPFTNKCKVWASQNIINSNIKYQSENKK
jgi:hypothetical protein